MNKYELVANKVLKECESQLGHDVVINHWKANCPFSGRAYCMTYTITVPQPKSDISLNTFLHELGHLVYQVKPSCLNEYMACKFALDKMKENGIAISRKVKRHHNWYVAYSLAQAINRKLKTIPQELKPFRKFISTRKVHYINGEGKTWISNQHFADSSKC